MYVVGLMSGTSVDGIDAALVDITMDPKLRIELIEFASVSYPEDLQRELKNAMSPNQGTIEQLTYLHYYLGRKFGELSLQVIDQAGMDRSLVELIGSHGHTIRNLPPREPYFPSRCRLQIADTAVIAEITGITTVGDFRPAEVAAGGEGAPLIANFDFHMFSSETSSRSALNIGGISNITYIPANGSIDDVQAFDLGPGNMIIDEVVWRISKGEKSYDAGGALAKQGTTDAKLLQLLLEHEFIQRDPPKSAGREEFGKQFVDELLEMAASMGIKDHDLLATVTEFTAAAIALNCRKYLGEIDELIVSGGGVHNKTLLTMLKEKLATSKVAIIDDYGIPSDAKEAMAFAFLGYQTLHRRVNNVPSATGARHPTIMGKISWAPPRGKS